MHQPDYRDKAGVMRMPWVFLHAIKDYYDMPWIVSRHSGLHVTFNLTPTLIAQLKLYGENPEESDRFLSLWIKDPAGLKEKERDWLVKLCKSVQPETMASPFPKYKTLYAQEDFSTAQMYDLEMLFMLSWCGTYLRRNNKTVATLIAKQQDYTQNDKKALLEILGMFVATVPKLYKMLNGNGTVALSTTPFYHPILPLLLDMQNAKKANSTTEIPANSIALKEDAVLQIGKAKTLFRETFGKVPTGFWPAEGAVDEKSVALLESLGVQWIATDESILYRSLEYTDKAQIYKPYRYNNMLIGFRDHVLSDKIGFEYRYKEANEAVEDFMSELQKIEKNNRAATVFVILDGENAWEFYLNNGYDFLEALYSRLSRTAWCQTLTMDSIQTFEAEKLEMLAPGSWINGTFDTWVGHREKTRAWELLFLTKKDYEHHADTLEETLHKKIGEHFLLAESSDWFWWYGDDHNSVFDEEFDMLFRNNLIDIYRLMGLVPPNDLFMPIVKNRSSGNFWIKPQSDISPMVNGKRDSFFEWMGCGVIYEDKLFSTMKRERGPVKTIYYGQDREKLYFAFEGEIAVLCKGVFLAMMVDPIGVHVKIPFGHQEMLKEPFTIKSACEEWLELSIEKKDFSRKRVFLRFEIEDASGSTLQILPGFGELAIDLNDDYSQNWFV